MRSIIILLLTISSNLLIAQEFTSVSALSQGKIIKLTVKETGIHKITSAQLQEAGVDVASIDPRQIKIYGNGGGPVPELLSIDRIDDLFENNIVVSGETDGSFDANDYIMFYGEGPSIWSQNEDGTDYNYIQNVYDLNNYYFLVISNGNGKRMQSSNPSGAVDYTSNTYKKNIRHESEQINLLSAFGSTEGTGQRWFGETFTNLPSQQFDEFVFDNISTGAEMNLRVAFATRSKTSNTINVVAGGQSFSRNTSISNTGDVEAVYAAIANINETFTPSGGSNMNVALSYNQNSSSAEGWLDYIQMSTTVDSRYTGDALTIYDPNSVNANVTEYAVNSSIPLKVYDVTTPYDVHEISATHAAGLLRFVDDNATALKRYHVFDPDSDFLSVSEMLEIPNQNVHGTPNSEYVIIYHPDFVEAAERLLAHRLNVKPLTTSLVDINEIYNEFSSGRTDPTAVRDFVRMMNLKYPEFNYVLLLGDGSFDFRNIVPDLEDQNFIPVYETKESLDPIRGFPSDDYYALLDDNEGLPTLKGAIDVAIGRLPAKSAEIANIMVDKIIHYETSKETFGDWRLKLAFSADDEDSNTHIDQADDIASKVQTAHPIYNQEKIYFDSFVQESTPGGARYPDATKKINDGVFKGQLILNYLGHGGPKGWAQERVLKITDINSWDNQDRLPVIITATCSFTGYDDPAIETAGEVAIERENGGAVALFTTTRAVYASSNKRLTEAVFDTILTRENGKYLRLGEIMRRAKNSNFQDTSTINSRKFTLIGDPTMTLAAPEHFVVVDKLNGQDANEESQDTFASLDLIELEGHVEDYFEQELSDFNGNIFITLYDKAKDIKTLVNDPKSKEKEFSVRENVLFKGSATVVNGRFSISFYIPKDINFNIGKGKISLYAVDEDNMTDAAGYFDNINIGGSTGSEIADDTPPIIELFMNDESFRDGGHTNANPDLLVKLEDDFGINISGTSIGHDLTAVLDGNTSNLFILNDFYSSEPNNSSKGSVLFPLENLTPGEHSITVKVWDIANNSAEETINFIVSDDPLDKILNTYSYPNPFWDDVTIGFEHDLDPSDLILTISIHDINGKLVKRLTSDTFAGAYAFALNELQWDGNDNFGSQLANGIYLFQINLRSSDGKINLYSDFDRLIKID